jgi:hypothetical protein
MAIPSHLSQTDPIWILVASVINATRTETAVVENVRSSGNVALGYLINFICLGVGIFFSIITPPVGSVMRRCIDSSARMWIGVYALAEFIFFPVVRCDIWSDGNCTSMYRIFLQFFLFMAYGHIHSTILYITTRADDFLNHLKESKEAKAKACGEEGVKSDNDDKEGAKPEANLVDNQR